MADTHGATGAITLTAGPTTGRQVGFTVLSGVWLLGGTLATLIGLGSVASGEDPFLGVLILVGVIAVWVLVVRTVLDFVRSLYWLEGTVVVQRRLRRDRRCDLMTAPIRADGTPRIIIGEPDAQPVVLPLHDPYRDHRPLAAQGLRALAEIISSRPDQSAQEVRDIVASLRQMAADPFGLRH